MLSSQQAVSEYFFLRCGNNSCANQFANLGDFSLHVIFCHGF
jgi:hypothetical protein